MCTAHDTEGGSTAIKILANILVQQHLLRIPSPSLPSSSLCQHGPVHTTHIPCPSSSMNQSQVLCCLTSCKPRAAHGVRREEAEQASWEERCSEQVSWQLPTPTLPCTRIATPHIMQMLITIPACPDLPSRPTPPAAPHTAAPYSPRRRCSVGPALAQKSHSVPHFTDHLQVLTLVPVQHWYHPPTPALLCCGVPLELPPAPHATALTPNHHPLIAC